MAAIKDFITRNYRHFNAAALVDAAQGYVDHLSGGGRMMVTLAGAMSTAELGLSLAEMIRRDKVHAITCTGANLEEDLFNLVAHDHYVRLPNYRYLTAEQEEELLSRREGQGTSVDAAATIKGQYFDWGKSKRCLARLMDDLAALPAAA